MTTDELKSFLLLDTTPNDQDDEYNIPIDISDIISICREYNNLGWQIQQQVENILEIGIEEAVKCGYVKKESLPKIKKFLRRVCENPYFGDATDQASNCIKLIQQYEEKHQIVYTSRSN
jgi:hypothetical protein